MSGRNRRVVKGSKQFVLIACAVFLIDRFSKWAAGEWFLEGLVVNKWLSLILTHNKGVSWSMFSSEAPLHFWIITGCIACLISIFALYVWLRWMNRMQIGLELSLLAAAVSNFLDRFLYGGVRDFILLHYNEYAWPVFNIADVVIVGVVALLLVDAWNRDE